MRNSNLLKLVASVLVGVAFAAGAATTPWRYFLMTDTNGSIVQVTNFHRGNALSMTVSSVASMLTNNPFSVTNFMVLGYHEENDGGGGMFQAVQDL